jgi:hypothetical protein
MDLRTKNSTKRFSWCGTTYTTNQSSWLSCAAEPYSLRHSAILLGSPHSSQSSAILPRHEIFHSEFRANETSMGARGIKLFEIPLGTPLTRKQLYETQVPTLPSQSPLRLESDQMRKMIWENCTTSRNSAQPQITWKSVMRTQCNADHIDAREQFGLGDQVRSRL